MVQGPDEPANAGRQQPWHIAYPLLVDRRLHGVAALELEPGRRDQLRSVMRQLQWGVGWIEVLLRRQQIARDSAQLARMAAAFDMVATALDHARFRDACNAAVTELAMRLDCDRVSVGFWRRQRIAVAAISHAAQFGQRMNLVRDVGAAMDEAVDQHAMVLYPPAGIGNTASTAPIASWPAPAVLARS